MRLLVVVAWARGSRFERAMRMMRRHDPQVAEDGFGLLQEITADHVEDLIAVFEVEIDHGMRCWLLELLGETGAAVATDLFVAQLASQNESLRGWAVRGLLRVDTKEARTALYQARAKEAAEMPRRETGIRGRLWSRP